MKTRFGNAYLGTGIPSILISLIILLIGGFAALTFISANSEMKLAEKSAAYCSDYYRAETTATEILSCISKGNYNGENKIKEDKNSNLVYNGKRGDIVIRRKANNFVFVIPINDKHELEVTAQLTEEHISIVNWAVK